MEPLVSKKCVVIVGGGVAGSVAAKILQDVADVHLIDPKEYFEITWASLRCTVEPSFAERTVIKHSEYAPNANIVCSAAVGVTENEVTTQEGRAIAYDYLVIATGHNDTTPATKQEKLSNYQADQDKIKAANGVLIVGGGPTGVELAAEIVCAFPGKKVTLVHRGSRLLEFIGEKASKKALNWLTAKNVEVILGQSVDLDSSSNGVYKTSGGESIIADCHFLCTGKPIGSSWLRESLLKDCLDDKGRLMVNPDLRVKGHANIFAIGDINDVKELKQGYLAQIHADLVSKNIKLLIKGKDKLTPYKSGTQMAIVSQGKKEGVAQIACVTMSGRIPGMMKSGDLFVTKTRKTLGLKSA
ncbi:oxidoreductase [Lithospermum erythrorhizon]|uniref:Oxidoreductase n=1 Tax=Lithospermum erythrorhizon TaxID=34254 RepID=A0AAV3RNB4_LITER